MEKDEKIRFHVPFIVIQAIKEFVESVEPSENKKRSPGKPRKVNLKTEISTTALSDYLKYLEGKHKFAVDNQHGCDEGKILRFGIYSPMSSLQLGLSSEAAKQLEAQKKARRVTGSKIISAALMTFLSEQKGFGDLFCDKCNRSVYGNTYLYSVTGRKILDIEGREINLKYNTCNLSQDKTLIGDPILQNDHPAYFIMPDSSNGKIIHQYGKGKIFSEKALAYPISDSLAEKLKRVISIKKPNVKALSELKYEVADVCERGLVKLNDGRYIATFSEPLFFV